MCFGCWCICELSTRVISRLPVQLWVGPDPGVFIFFYCRASSYVCLGEDYRWYFVVHPVGVVLSSGTSAQCVVGWMYNVSGQCICLLGVSGHCVLAVRFCSVICCWLMAIWMNVVHMLVVGWLFFFFFRVLPNSYTVSTP